MAKNKQTPPGLNGPSVYGKAISAIAQVLREDDDEPREQSSRLGLERPQDFLQRSVREGLDVSVSFSSGGLLSREKMPTGSKEDKLRPEQKALLYVARQRKQFNNKGKA